MRAELTAARAAGSGLGDHHGGGGESEDAGAGAAHGVRAGDGGGDDAPLPRPLQPPALPLLRRQCLPRPRPRLLRRVARLQPRRRRRPRLPRHGARPPPLLLRPPPRLPPRRLLRLALRGPPPQGPPRHRLRGQCGDRSLVGGSGLGNGTIRCRVPLNRRQCFLLVAAGSLTHFFLDHLFEENGHSRTYTWILSTGWWEGRAPINFDAVVVIGLLCTSLIGGFIYINRVKSGKSGATKAAESMGLILFIMCLYCLWCSGQLYWRDPPHPAVGEEADLGVIVFLAVYFFLPHTFCILSMNSKEYLDSPGQLPL